MDEFGIRFGPQEVSQKNHQTSVGVRKNLLGRAVTRGDSRGLKIKKMETADFPGTSINFN
jgi:hypothetical protein